MSRYRIVSVVVLVCGVAIVALNHVATPAGQVTQVALDAFGGGMACIGLVEAVRCAP